MIKRQLGQTGLEVTELCFGALPFGPLQKNVDVVTCTEIVIKALESGINFIDTAQMYLTYEPIKRAMKATGIRPILATKSTASDYDSMQKAIDEALLLLDVDYIDIFHLHAARANDKVFEERKGAWQCLKDNKAKGRIKAIGMSTHSVLATRAAAQNQDLDVIFPIININGTGILHGNREDMLEAIDSCVKAGKGLYIMKALGGGSLIDQYDEAMTFARSINGSASVALGMVNPEELDFNLKYFEGRDAKTLSMPSTRGNKKRFIAVKYICNNCGKCRTACPNEAIIEKEGVSFIDDSKCLTCGYCVGACDLFGIRMI
ncbi:MAG: aldo/keto reductase [Clostridia bacterium]|nr:aldo/keto reductase [Clostridia bacterium]